MRRRVDDGWTRKPRDHRAFAAGVLVFILLLASAISGPSVGLPENQMRDEVSGSTRGPSLEQDLCQYLNGLLCDGGEISDTPDWAEPTNWAGVRYASDLDRSVVWDCHPPFVTCVIAVAYALRTCYEIDESFQVIWTELHYHKSICVGAAVSAAATATLGYTANSIVEVYAAYGDDEDSTELIGPIDFECFNESLYQYKTDCNAAASVGDIAWIDGGAPSDCFESSGSATATLGGLFSSTIGATARSKDCPEEDLEILQILDESVGITVVDGHAVHHSEPELVDLTSRVFSAPDDADFVDIPAENLTNKQKSLIHEAISSSVTDDLNHLLPAPYTIPPILQELVLILEQDLEHSVRSIPIEDVRIYHKPE